MLQGSPVLTADSVPEASITIREFISILWPPREHAHTAHGGVVDDRGLRAGFEHDAGTGVLGVFLHAVYKEGELHHVEGIAHPLGAVPVRRPCQPLGMVGDQLAAFRHGYAVPVEPYLVHVEYPDVPAEHSTPVPFHDDNRMARLSELPSRV